MPELPNIPKAVTSFGAAIADQTVYVYGGHTGTAHAYSHDEQGRTLWQLSLRDPKRWEALGEGPPLQGLALVAHKEKLYRVGGFTAKNEEGEEHDLWSQANVACFDLATGQWHDLPSLPEPRSSFDAAVLNDTLYVVGGWSLQGEQDEQWLETAYALDLKSAAPAWRAIAKPPFQRRALAVAAHDGKLYAIGGMQRQGGPTTRVDVYDPKSDSWSQAASLEGEPMEGFGSAAFATGGKLYVSTIHGNLQVLSKDGSDWSIVRKLDAARFFHRMLPLDENQLLMVGGADMSVGKFDHLEVVDVR